MDLKVIPGAAGGGARPPAAPPRRRRLFGRGAMPCAPVVGPDEVGLRPAEALILLYLTVTGCLMVALHLHVRAWGALALGHLIAIIAILRGSAGEPRGPRAVHLARDFVPILLLPLFYFEYAWLTRLTGAAPHDALVAGWEQALFGMQPSRELRQLWPWPFLSQYLHGAYFAYYLVPPMLALTLYFTGRWRALQEAFTTLLLSFFGCGLVFILFPVAGPYHHYGVPELGPLGGGVAALTHTIIENGSSVGTAFPSSHTAVAVAVWVSALRLSPRVFWIQALIVPALVVGTVYGGFHYAVDALAGVLWGVAAGCLGPYLHAFLASRLPRPRARPRVALSTPLPKTGGGS